MKNIQKTNEICYCLGGGGGGIQNLGREISPPKGPEKKNPDPRGLASCGSQLILYKLPVIL